MNYRRLFVLSLVAIAASAMLFSLNVFMVQFIGYVAVYAAFGIALAIMIALKVGMTEYLGEAANPLHAVLIAFPTFLLGLSVSNLFLLKDSGVLKDDGVPDSLVLAAVDASLTASILFTSVFVVIFFIVPLIITKLRR